MPANRILHILSLIAFLAGMAIVPWWTVDDAYISYRYAENFAETGQMVWNPSGDPVEGYSGVLLPLLAALFSVMEIDMVFAIKICSLLASFFTAWLIYKSLRTMNLARIPSAAGSFFFLLVPIVYVHSLSGLETSIFVILVYWYFWMLLRIDRPKGTLRQILAGLVGLACVLARPEGILWVGLGTVTAALFARESFASVIKQKLWVKGIIVMIGTGLYLFWKWEFYGTLVPNTYYAKAFPGFFNVESVKEAARFGIPYLLLPTIAAIASTALIRGRGMDSKFKWFFWTMALVFLITMGSYVQSQLFMNYGGRFFYPFLPAGIILACYLIDKGLRKAMASKLKTATVATFFILGLGQLGLLVYRYTEEFEFVRNYDAVMEQEWKPAAEFLKETVAAKSKVILYQDAGFIAHDNDFQCIDFGRLNDEFLALGQPNPEVAADYFFSQDAAAVVFTSFEKDRYVYFEEGETIHADPRFQAYELAATFSNDRAYPYHQFVYLKK